MAHIAVGATAGEALYARCLKLMKGRDDSVTISLSLPGMASPSGQQRVHSLIGTSTGPVWARDAGLRQLEQPEAWCVFYTTSIVCMWMSGTLLHANELLSWQLSLMKTALSWGSNVPRPASHRGTTVGVHLCTGLDQTARQIVESF